MEKSSDNIVVERIFALLQENKLQQKDFAQAVGITTGNVSDWKKGRCLPSIKVLPKIADYFGVTTDYLLGQAEAVPAINEETKVMIAYSRASEEVKHAIRILLKLE